jgi:hypothetical protein
MGLAEYVEALRLGLIPKIIRKDFDAALIARFLPDFQTAFVVEDAARKTLLGLIEITIQSYPLASDTIRVELDSNPHGLYRKVPPLQAMSKSLGCC